MNILKLGITGFNKPKNIQQHSINAMENLLKNIKYPFVNNSEIQLPNNNTNYFRIAFINQIENSKFDVLINQYYWIMCGVKTDSEWMNLQFLELDNQFKNQIQNFEPKIQILDVVTLNHEIEETEKANLGKTEIEQMEYWNSKTYGEIVFNGFD